MILRPTKFGAPRHLPPVSTDPINMSQIRVSGIGGLGLVAMAVLTAVLLPEAGVPVAAGLILGVVLAVVLIKWRSRRGVGVPPARPPSRFSPRSR